MSIELCVIIYYLLIIRYYNIWWNPKMKGHGVPYSSSIWTTVWINCFKNNKSDTTTCDVACKSINVNGIVRYLHGLKINSDDFKCPACGRFKPHLLYINRSFDSRDAQSLKLKQVLKYKLNCICLMEYNLIIPTTMSINYPTVQRGFKSCRNLLLCVYFLCVSAVGTTTCRFRFFFIFTHNVFYQKFHIV